ncbi:MAG TPA: hypothetical protein VER55_10990 [Ardenticatenaceae bacterium]|nr:hypothetical protein [Ardenticatenaceae bacterium]
MAEQSQGQSGGTPHDPGRTPGQAEGTERDVEQTQSGGGGGGGTKPSGPGRTPGQAEGSKEDVEETLREQ